MQVDDPDTILAPHGLVRRAVCVSVIGAVAGGVIAIGMSMVLDVGTLRGARGEGKGGLVVTAA